MHLALPLQLLAQPAMRDRPVDRHGDIGLHAPPSTRRLRRLETRFVIVSSLCVNLAPERLNVFLELRPIRIIALLSSEA